ncbi:MAG: hypothetical protein R2932_13210 [Caldilineaceae bacterium]
MIFPLDYPRGCTDRIPGPTACKAAATAASWVTNFGELGGPYEGDYYSHPQPWLTDIEFDGDAMILDFRDRMGDLLGVKTAPPRGIGTSCRDNLCSAITAGDLLRAVPSGDDLARIENNATAGSLTTGGAK